MVQWETYIFWFSDSFLERVILMCAVIFKAKNRHVIYQLVGLLGLMVKPYNHILKRQKKEEQCIFGQLEGWNLNQIFFSIVR
jgi:hypothetical protein